MRDFAATLTDIVNQFAPRLTAIDSADSARRPALGKWSVKETLGHLVDSASNNHQRFVRLLTTDRHVDFVGYRQDAWVESQDYQGSDWPRLVMFWQAYNEHLAHFMVGVDPGHLTRTISIDGNTPVQFAQLLRDYVEHLLHHLRVIVPDVGSLPA